MTESNPTNRELAIMIGDMREHELKPILIQAVKTNGRVSLLEKMIYLASGAIIVITPLSIWMLTTIIGLREDSTRQQAALPGLIQSAVTEAIRPYTVPAAPH